MTPDKSRHDRAIKELNKKRIFPFPVDYRQRRYTNPLKIFVLCLGLLVAASVALIIILPHSKDIDLWYRNPRHQAWLLLGLSLFVALWAFVKWRNRNY